MKRTICLLLTLLLTLSAFASCKPGGGTEDGTDEGTLPPEDENAMLVIGGGTCAYTVVRAENAKDFEVEAAVELRNLLRDTFLVDVEIGTDFIMRGQEMDPAAKEILIGNTNREESVRGYEGLGKDEYRIVTGENRIAICGGSERALRQGMDVFFGKYADLEAKSFSVPKNASWNGEYVYTSKAEYTGETLRVNMNDKYLGGGQFITKLYTEGLGRAPEGKEYAAIANEFLEIGIDASSLRAVVQDFFASEEMASMHYTDTEAAYAVYRSVLNRDPTKKEIAAFDASDLSAAALAAATTAEFTMLIPKIIAGGYSWGKNNAENSTGGPVYTASEVNQMLKEQRVVALPQNSLVLCDVNIQVGGGKVLTTEGQPDNYLKMARFLRTKNYGEAVINLEGSATLSHVWVDGNRTGVGRGDGGNVYVGGSDVEVIGNKMCDTIGPTNMPVLCVMTGIYIAENLITCYSSNHNDGWTDGITHQGRGIIENNAVVDATDVPIIVFRDWTGAPQDSIVRNNKVINTGNSAYAALHTDAWQDEGDMSFTGCTFYGNEIWTSWKTHFNLGLSTASKAWFSLGNDAKDAAFYNNYTPEGTFAVCGIAIVSDGMNNAVMRGNQLNVYIADIAGSRFGNHLVAANTAVYPADIQGPYDECAVHTEDECFIGDRINEGASALTLKKAVVWEDFQKIPAKIESQKHSQRKIG